MKICSVEGCNGKYYAKGYCSKHYQQIKRHSKILERTIFDLNEFIIHSDYAEIIIFDKKGNEKIRALIDIEDIDRINKHKWCESNGYIVCAKLNVRLHRFILNCSSDMFIDHINGNRLDNRKQNLRICTQTENNRNTKTPLNNTSGIKGVYWDKKLNKWRVKICVNRKQIHLGLYDTLEKAKEVRQKAEKKYFGEFRRKE